MEQLLGWVRGILCCLLAMSLLLRVVPAKYRPYLRLFAGIVFLLTALSPLTGLTGMEERLQEKLEEFLENGGTETEWEIRIGDSETWLKEQIAGEADRIARDSREASEEESPGEPEEEETRAEISVRLEMEEIVPVEPAGR